MLQVHASIESPQRPNIPISPKTQHPQVPSSCSLETKTWMPAFVVMLSLDKCSKNLLSSDRFIQGNFFAAPLILMETLRARCSHSRFHVLASIHRSRESSNQKEELNWRLQAESFRINPHLHRMDKHPKAAFALLSGG